MRTLLILKIAIFLMCANIQTLSASSGLNFKNASWDEVLEEAREKNLPIFVKTYASYCMPCRMMDSEVFPKPEVAQYFNENFVNFKVDMQSKIGSIFNLVYSVEGIPDLLFINPAGGDIITRSNGGKSYREVLSLGAEALEKYNNEMLLASSRNEPSLVLDKLNAKIHFDSKFLKNEEIKLTENAITNSSSYLEEVFNGASNFNSNKVDILLDNKESFIKAFGEDKINSQLMQASSFAIEEAILSANDQLFEKTINIVSDLDNINKASEILNLELKYHQGTNNWGLYSKSVKNYINRTFEPNATLIITAGETIVENTSDRKNLKMAEKWAKKLSKQYMTYDYYYNYAIILIKQEKYVKAEKIAQKAFQRAQFERIDVKECQVLLKQIAYLK